MVAYQLLQAVVYQLRQGVAYQQHRVKILTRGIVPTLIAKMVMYYANRQSMANASAPGGR